METCVRSGNLDLEIPLDTCNEVKLSSCKHSAYNNDDAWIASDLKCSKMQLTKPRSPCLTYVTMDNLIVPKTTAFLVMSTLLSFAMLTSAACAYSPKYDHLMPRLKRTLAKDCEAASLRTIYHTIISILFKYHSPGTHLVLHSTLRHTNAMPLVANQELLAPEERIPVNLPVGCTNSCRKSLCEREMRKEAMLALNVHACTQMLALRTNACTSFMARQCTYRRQSLIISQRLQLHHDSAHIEAAVHDAENSAERALCPHRTDDPGALAS